MWFQNYYLSLQKQLKQKVMEKQKSFEQIINEVSASIVNNRKVLDGIVDDIFNKHDVTEVITQHPSAPTVYVDDVLCSAYTLDKLSYDKQTKTLYIDCSDEDSVNDITNRSIELELYVGLVQWIVEFEDRLFAGDFTDYVEEYEFDEDDLPF